jgi:hypothetical protein
VGAVRMFGMSGRESLLPLRDDGGSTDGREPLENFPPLHQEEIPIEETAT